MMMSRTIPASKPTQIGLLEAMTSKHTMLAPEQDAPRKLWAALESTIPRKCYIEDFVSVGALSSSNKCSEADSGMARC